MNPTPVLSANAASVTIDGTTLLKPTSFVASAGEFWCVTGPNGSGKTTLLRAFLGSRSLTAGSCQVMGEESDLTRPAHRRFIASLVDSIPVARDMTIREQVGLVAASWLGNEGKAAKRADEILERLGLAGLHARFPHQVSSGQLQLFNLALTLVRPAVVTLLDEPERHLDDNRIQLVVDLLLERANEGVVLLVSTHESAFVAASSGEVGLK